MIRREEIIRRIEKTEKKFGIPHAHLIIGGEQTQRTLPVRSVAGQNVVDVIQGPVRLAAFPPGRAARAVSDTVRIQIIQAEVHTVVVLLHHFAVPEHGAAGQYQDIHPGKIILGGQGVDQVLGSRAVAILQVRSAEIDHHSVFRCAVAPAGVAQNALINVRIEPAGKGFV